VPLERYHLGNLSRSVDKTNIVNKKWGKIKRKRGVNVAKWSWHLPGDLRVMGSKPLQETPDNI